MPAIYNIGKTAIRDALKSMITHLGVSTDQTAFDAAQNAIDPANGGSTNLLVKASVESNAGTDGDAFDASMTINGDSEYTGKKINSVGVANGSSRTSFLSRTVVDGPTVQTNDVMGVSTRWLVEDNTT